MFFLAGLFGEVHRGTYKGTLCAIKKFYNEDNEVMQKYIAKEIATLAYVSSSFVALCEHR